MSDKRQPSELPEAHAHTFIIADVPPGSTGSQHRSEHEHEQHRESDPYVSHRQPGDAPPQHAVLAPASGPYAGLTSNDPAPPPHELAAHLAAYGARGTYEAGTSSFGEENKGPAPPQYVEPPEVPLERPTGLGLGQLTRAIPTDKAAGHHIESIPAAREVILGNR